MSEPAASTSSSIQQHLYSKRETIYPRQVSGLFARLRVIAALVLLGIYYGVPWLQWDGRQAVLFDLPERKFYIFGLVIWPQDFIYLTGLLIIAALALFFFTAVAGRLWCGYACPQTVWTESFLWIQRKIEGDRNQQIKLAKSPWNLNKIYKKSLLHSIWILFSLWTGLTFVGYFMPIDEIATRMVTLSLSGWALFWVLFYSFATYGNAGWMREQVCIYMCPYARFQSAMFDKNTLIISYDNNRGEPRGGRRKRDDHKAKGLGDCINCSLCVQVCPTGIDIRDGLQYQCIGCAACIDVCDEVMEKMAYPKGLIRYTTENSLEGNKTRLLRPRVIIYALILLTVMGAILFSISNRSAVELDVLRDRNSLYRETNYGLVENIYTLKVINKDSVAHEYTISASGIEDLKLEVDNLPVTAESGEVSNVITRLVADPEDLVSASTKVEFTIQAIDNPEIRISEQARFIGPR